jgi:hypothetical protein
MTRIASRAMRVGSLVAVMLAALPGLLPWCGPLVHAQTTVPVVAADERRIAVVIGNGSYPQIPLPNPVNDARLISERLRELGFEVRTYLDLGVRPFRRVLREYVEQLQHQDGVAVFYYAGHGVQIEGRNYLLPVDIDLTLEEEVKYESIDIDEMFISRLDQVRAQARIVILDACRDNPFGGARRTLRSAGGLAEMAARGTLIAYASAPGQTAEDGPGGGNSVYTRHLADELRSTGLEVEQMFKRVRVKVIRDTHERQVPWVNTSLTVNFSFNPQVGPDPAEAERQEQIQALEAELAQTRRLLEQTQQGAAQRTGNTTQGATAAPEAPERAPALDRPKPAPVAKSAPTKPKTAGPVVTAEAVPDGVSRANAAVGATSAAPTEIRRLQEQIRQGEETLKAIRRQPPASSSAASAVQVAKYKSAPAMPEAEARPRSTPTNHARCADLLVRLSLGEPIGAEAENLLHSECK